MFQRAESKRTLDTSVFRKFSCIFWFFSESIGIDKPSGWKVLIVLFRRSNIVKHRLLSHHPEFTNMFYNIISLKLLGVFLFIFMSVMSSRRSHFVILALWNAMLGIRTFSFLIAARVLVPGDNEKPSSSTIGGVSWWWIRTLRPAWEVQAPK